MNKNTLFIYFTVTTWGSQQEEAKKKTPAQLFREAISQLSNHLHQTATGGPILAAWWTNFKNVKIKLIGKQF